MMKILYQQIWEGNLTWDEEIPQSCQAQHLTWREQLPLLTSKRLPRCYFRVDPPYQSLQLHGFSDASEKAYSAVVYVRTTYYDHPPVVSLVPSKTKVAPLKPLTIPRLELCGATLHSKLLTSVSTALDIPIKSVYACCDSTIVVAWLDGNPKRYRMFVGNRIASILKAIPPETWKHVPTLENPADCASRGMLPGELLDQTLWWEGPIWLMSDSVQTPMQPSLRPLSTPELRVVTCNINVPVTPWIEGRYASYHKIITVTAWCFRFVLNLQLKHRNQPRITTPHLTTTEVNQA